MDVERIAKPWGAITRIWDTPTLRIEPIEILPGGYSSRHVHWNQRNAFILCEGSVDIRIFEDDEANDDKPCYVKELRKPFDAFIVDAGDWHQFFCYKPSKLIEVYFPAEVCADDIERRSENGREPQSIKGDGFVMGGEHFVGANFILD